MTNVLEAPQTAGERFAAFDAEYFQLLAAQAQQEGNSDNTRAHRIRELAKVLSRDRQADEKAATALWTFRRDVGTSIPAKDPTVAEIKRCEAVANESRVARKQAAVEIECYDFRVKRQAANQVPLDRIEARQEHERLRQELVKRKQDNAAAEAKLAAMRAGITIRPIAAAHPQLAEALGIAIE